MLYNYYSHVKMDDFLIDVILSESWTPYTVQWLSVSKVLKINSGEQEQQKLFSGLQD